jgi:hypothetical protein
MGVAAAVYVGLSAASAIGSYNQSKSQARQAIREGEIAMQNRADEIRSLAAKQRVSYISAGLELEGTPQAVITDTYNKGIADVNAIRDSANQTSKNILTAARAKLLGDMAKTVVGAYSLGAFGGAAGGTTAGTTAAKGINSSAFVGGSTQTAQQASIATRTGLSNTTSTINANGSLNFSSIKF